VTLVFVAASLPAGAFAAFPAPITANPSAQFTAAIGINHNAVQSHTRTLSFDINNPTISYPQLYWFKFTSDGQCIAKFDTLGSDFGTNGPGNPSGGGMVLGSYNQSQMAVYSASGQSMGVSKGTRNLAGDPVTTYSGYSKDPTQWYVSQGLSETYFQPSPPSNPHWSVSPTDPTPYTGWAAPGNDGNSQKYYPPHYRTSLNEYQVWNTSLGTIMLDSNNQPVINPDTGEPRPNPGWRHADRMRHGPGTPWNRFGVLPAGDYYIAVASGGPTFQGDLSQEEYLRAPVHFDYSTFQNYQRVLNGPLGTFQYYMAPSTGAGYFGTIRLNVTTLPVGLNNDAQWSADTSGNWQDAGKWSAGVPNGADSTARLLSTIGSPRTLSLTQKTVLGTLQLNNASSYTISGSEYLAFFSSGGTSSISVQAGSHLIDAPVHFHNAANIDVNSGAALSISKSLSYFTAVAMNKTGAGTLNLTAGGGSASVDMPVYASLNIASGAVNLAGDHELGAIALTNTSLTVGNNGAGNAAGKLQALQLIATGGGTATLSQPGATNSANIRNLVKVNANTALRKNGSGILVTKSLSLDATARLDLSGGGVVIDYTGNSILSTVKGLIVSGRNSGAWDGVGISSSTAAGNPLTGIGYADTSVSGAGTFGDQNVDGDAMLVRYTWLGDSNVDATVDSLDLNALLAGYGKTSDAHWYEGDYDYDGKVNTLDFNHLAGSFGQTLAGPSLGTVVPEPGVVATITCAVVFMNRRRRIIPRCNPSRA